MKRIISLILAFILIFPCISVFAEDSTNQSEDIGYCLELLDAIGVDVNIADPMSVKKSEFLHMIMQIINLADGAHTESSFQDVRADSYYISSVENALGAGIISKSDNFYPNNQIKFPEACKIMVSALGYDYLAASRGGYPAGYMTTADTLNLIDGTTYNADLTMESALTLIWNFLEADVNMIAGIKDKGGPTYVYESIKNVLYIYHDIKRVQGIVTADENTGLYEGDFHLEKGYIAIDDVTYKNPVCKESLIGKRVNAFIKETGDIDTLVYSYVYDNRIVEASFDEMGDLKDGYAVYYEGNKEKKLLLSSGHATIYNGKAVIDRSYKSMAVRGSTLEFVDNDRDGKYDVVSIRKYDVYYVENVDLAKKILIDKNNQILFLSDEEKRVTVKKSGEIIGLEDIAPGDLLCVYQSLDSSVVEIVVSTCPSVTGKITEYNTVDKKVYIGENEYSYGEYFEKYFFNESVLNKTAKFLFTDDGVVQVMTDRQTEEIQYAYLIATDIKKGIDTTIKAKILTQSGDIKVFTLPKKVNYNGIMTESANLGEKFYGPDGNGKPQLLRISYTIEDVLTLVDTWDGSYDVLTGNENEYDKLVRYKYPDDTNIIYIKATALFIPYHRVAIDAPVFVIANDESLSDEDRYKVFARSYFDDNDTKGQNTSTTIQTYNVTQSGDAGAVIVSTDTGGDRVGDSSYYGLVYSVRRAIDTEGAEGISILVFSDGMYKRYFVDNEQVLINMAAQTSFDETEETVSFDNPCIRKGDYIRFNANQKNYISALVKDYSIKSDKVLFVHQNHYNRVTYYYGRIYAKGDGLISMLPENIYSPASDITNHANRFTFLLPSTITVYDTETGEVSEGTAAEIIPYVANPGDCSRILVRTGLDGAVLAMVLFN